MHAERENVYPDCPFTTRTVEIGGLAKSELIRKLQEHAIHINEYGERLLNDDTFTTSTIRYLLETVELTVSDLGFPDGATLTQIFDRALEVGLALCPLELGPHLRLQYLDQPEMLLEKTAKQRRAPSGSITIASAIQSEDDSFPKGFYLRRMNSVLWLRGYVADDLHVWNSDDHFIFLSNRI